MVRSGNREPVAKFRRLSLVHLSARTVTIAGDVMPSTSPIRGI